MKKLGQFRSFIVLLTLAVALSFSGGSGSLALANEGSCARTGLSLERLRTMTPDEQKNWERLLGLQSLQALGELANISFPQPEKIAMTVALTGDVARQVIEVYDKGDKKESRKLYGVLIQTLNRLKLDEEVLRHIGNELFVDEAFFSLLRKVRFAGTRSFAKKFSEELRRKINTLQKQIGLRNKSTTPTGIWHTDLFLEEKQASRDLRFRRSMTLHVVGIVVSFMASSYFFKLRDTEKANVKTEASYVIAKGSGWFAQMRGNEALGWGTYFKRDEAEQTLGPRYIEAKENLESVRKSAVLVQQVFDAEDRLIQVLQERIYGGYTHWMSDEENGDVYSATTAVHVLDSQFGSHGIAQQKVVILNAILNDLKISAFVEGGVVDREGRDDEHVWVRTRDRFLVIDPTWNYAGPAERYYERYVKEGPYPVSAEGDNLMNKIAIPESEGRSQ